MKKVTELKVKDDEIDNLKQKMEDVVLNAKTKNQLNTRQNSVKWI